MLNIKAPTHFIRGVNQYVPKMTGVAGVNNNMEAFVDFGTPNVAVAAGILSAVAVNATYTVANFITTTAGFTGNTGVLDALWGRELVAVASGAATNACTLIAEDYLGQLMKKTVTLNGATPVPLGIAVKRVISFQIPSGGASTVSLGFTNLLGVPYKTSAVLQEFVDGVRIGTAGTLTAPVTTDPATITTGDPRGLISPTTTPDGVKRFHFQLLLNSYYNSSGNGGLHGIRHFYA